MRKGTCKAEVLFKIIKDRKGHIGITLGNVTLGWQLPETILRELLIGLGDILLDKKTLKYKGKPLDNEFLARVGLIMAALDKELEKVASPESRLLTDIFGKKVKGSRGIKSFYVNEKGEYK